MEDEAVSDSTKTKCNSNQDDIRQVTEDLNALKLSTIQPALRRMIHLGYELEPYRARNDDGRGISSVDRLGFTFVKAWNLEMFSEKMHQEFYSQNEQLDVPHQDGEKQCEEKPKNGWPSTVVVDVVKKVLSSGGGACRPAAIFILAACCRCEGPIRPAAYSCVKQLNRPEDLMLFIKYAMELSPKRKGWGAGLRRAVKSWYIDRFGVMEMAEFVTQIKQRYSWTHKDILRQAHVKPKNQAQEVVLQYTLFGMDKARVLFNSIPEDDLAREEAKHVIEYLEAAEKLRKLRIPKGKSVDCSEVKDAVSLIKDHKFSIEHCDDSMYAAPKVWEVALGQMTLWQLLVYLPVLRFNRLLRPGCELTKVVLHSLRQAGESVAGNYSGNMFTCVSPALVLISMQTFRRKNTEVVHGKSWFKTQSVTKQNEESASKGGGTNQSTTGQDGTKGVGQTSCEKRRLRMPSDLPKASSKVLEAMRKVMVTSIKTMKPTGKRFVFGAANIKEKVRCAVNPYVMTFEAAAITYMCMDSVEAEGALIGFSVTSEETSCRRLRSTGYSLSNCTREIMQGISSSPVKVDWWVKWLCQEKCYADVLVLMADEVFCEKGSGEKLFEEFSKYRSDLNLPHTRLLIISLTSEKFPWCDALRNEDVLMVYGFDSHLPFIIQHFARGDF